MIRTAPQVIVDQTAASVSTPDAGTIFLFSEGGQLKYKKPDGTVVVVT